MTGLVDSDGVGFLLAVFLRVTLISFSGGFSSCSSFFGAGFGGTCEGTILAGGGIVEKPNAERTAQAEKK